MNQEELIIEKLNKNEGELIYHLKKALEKTKEINEIILIQETAMINISYIYFWLLLNKHYNEKTKKRLDEITNNILKTINATKEKFENDSYHKNHLH